MICNKNLNARRRALTLVELVVLLVICGLIAVLAINRYMAKNAQRPTTQPTTQEAQTTATLGAQRTIIIDDEWRALEKELGVWHMNKRPYDGDITYTPPLDDWVKRIAISWVRIVSDDGESDVLVDKDGKRKGNHLLTIDGHIELSGPIHETRYIDDCTKQVTFMPRIQPGGKYRTETFQVTEYLKDTGDVVCIRFIDE